MDNFLSYCGLSEKDLPVHSNFVEKEWDFRVQGIIVNQCMILIRNPWNNSMNIARGGLQLHPLHHLRNSVSFSQL